MTFPDISTTAQIEAKDNAAKKKSFEDFMAKPTIRLLISTLPSAESKETISTLLQEAHSSGWSGGSGQMMLMLLEGLLKPRGDFR